MTSPRLTHRERQVAAAVARGLTNRSIAAQLGLSDRTVEHHVGSILSKCDFVSRSEIIVAALQGRLDVADPAAPAIAV